MRHSKLALLPVGVLTATSAFALGAKDETQVGLDLRYDMLGLKDSSATAPVPAKSGVPATYWGWSLYLSHNFTEHVGFEVGYYQYLTPSAKTTGTVNNASGNSYDGVLHGDTNTALRRGLYTDVLVGMNAGAAMRVWGLLGAAVEDSTTGSKTVDKASASFETAGTYYDEIMPFHDVVTLNIGAGAQYMFHDRIGVRLVVKYGFQYVSTSNSDISVALGVNYAL